MSTFVFVVAALCFVFHSSYAACNQCSKATPSANCDSYQNDQLTVCNDIEYLNDLFYTKTSTNWNGGWWNTANSVETSVNYVNWNPNCKNNQNMTQQCSSIMDILSNVMNQHCVIPTNSKVWYDDMSWWSLAAMRMYEYTNNDLYLHKSISFAEYVWDNAWDTQYCNGGLWWSYAKGYKNAITNELGMTIFCKLYTITNNQTYNDRCLKIYNWFMQSGMINNEFLINDGLTINSNNRSDCYNNEQNTWSYNQGVIFGGLKYLAMIDDQNKDNYVQLAVNIFNAVNQKMTDGNGILHELVSASSVRSSNDAQQFKGIYVRYVQYLFDYLNDNSKYSDMIDFAKKQMNGLTEYASDVKENSKCKYLFDPVWNQPFVECDSIAQTSSLDAFNWAWIVK